MSTKTQTAKYDRGYGDALEGQEPRSSNAWYVQGYTQGRILVSEIITERMELNARAAS